MEDKHIMDASIVASLQERNVFNDIDRWNKIFVKWGSVRESPSLVLEIE
jgi:hypothetical protein